MASSDRTPLGYRRTDPDETAGRLLYRQRADYEAWLQQSLTRKMKLRRDV
jgi:hypothetical protein